MTILDRACWERGCPCYDKREGDGVEVVEKKDWVALTPQEVGELTVMEGLNHIEVPLLAELVWAVEAKCKEKNAQA